MPVSLSWIQVTTPGTPTPRYGCSMVPTANGIQIFGGYSTHYLNESLSFQSQSEPKKWRLRRRSRPYPAGRRGHIMVGLDECQLLFGGDLGSACVNDLWICTGSEWRQIFGHSDTGSAPAGRYGHAGCVQNSCLYVFGGADRYQQTSMFGDLWILDLTTLRWSKGPEGPSPRYGHSMVIVGKDIFVIGGMTQNGLVDDVWHLWVDENHELSWIQLNPTSKDQAFPPRTEFFATELSHSSVLLFGGSSTQAPLNDMWILNIDTQQHLYTSVCLQIPSALPAPRHAFGAITTSTGTISSAHVSEIAAEFGGRDRSLIWLTDSGSMYTPDHTNDGSYTLFNGSFIKLYIFGGRGADSSLNDLWECTLCLLEEAGMAYGIQETKLIDRNRLTNLGTSFSNINYPPNSDIDLYRSGDSFGDYNSRTLGAPSTDIYISHLTEERSLLYDKPSIQLPTDSFRPNVPRFPEVQEEKEKPSIARRMSSAKANDVHKASFMEHASINDPSLLSNNVSREDHDANESITPFIHRPQQALIRETLKQQSRPPSGGTGSPYRMTTSNPDQPIQPTDEVQKYLLTQMVTINENLLKMEAAFEAAELARKFSEDLAEQSSAVDELALAVSEFKNDVMHAIEGLSQKLSGYAITQQGHEEDIVELNGKLNELDNLIVERASDTTRDELFMEMQVRITNLIKENKALTTRLTNVESLLIATTLANNPTDEILTLLNAVVNQSATLSLDMTSQTITDISKENLRPDTGTSSASSQVTGATLQGVFNELQEMGKKLNALSNSMGTKSQLSMLPGDTNDEKVTTQFDQPRQRSQPQQARQLQASYQNEQVVPQFGGQQRMQQRIETRACQGVTISPHSAVTRTSTMSRSSGSLSAQVVGEDQRDTGKPMSALLSAQGRPRSFSASTSRKPSNESLAMIAKVLNAPDELSDD
ncbi:Tip elongation aberrant protein 1 [Giardia lamblia P15]|uniref:Tip elongation aberrant protein 1 n=1 Tax=Giardia intestinalis (strain P15) TaxID=658858 RepID=E1EY39_GIAIA|nr:Tip elongation aberrant protein 1 [Giardia lamblia P15]